VETGPLNIVMLVMIKFVFGFVSIDGRFNLKWMIFRLFFLEKCTFFFNSI